MTRKGLTIASILSGGALVAVAVALGATLAADVRLPIHWNLQGEPDAFAGKWVALLMPAGMTAILSLLFHFLPAIEPRRKNLARSQGPYLWAWAVLLVIAWVIMFVLAATALGWNVPVNRVIAGAVGLVLVLIGNQLGKSRSMYLVGLRTPWTLDDEEVWIKSNRLAGKLMVAAGLAMVLAALLPIPPVALGIVAGVGIAIGVVVPVVHSFILWRRVRRDQPSE
ncbi:MAG TPA: SdpI family protein [Allosphingosinicella sp.]|nr:SdpI family protein [Allosphingosinicella sp.]